MKLENKLIFWIKARTTKDRKKQVSVYAMASFAKRHITIHCGVATSRQIARIRSVHPTNLVTLVVMPLSSAIVIFYWIILATCIAFVFQRYEQYTTV